MITFTKQPQDVLDYDVDMTAWFAGSPGDEIESVALTVTAALEASPTLVIGPTPHPDYVLIGASPLIFKVWLGGGTEFVDYVVTALVTTEQDRQKEIEFKVKVRNK